MFLNDMKKRIIYPKNKDFAFTIFDDTDVSTLENIKPIYDYLYSLGILTTKSVWPLKYNGGYSDFAGSHTLEDKEYAKYVKGLSERGFEIAFHGAAMESSLRETTIAGLERFRDVVGYCPRSYACHGKNRENLYWGSQRFSFGVFGRIYGLLDRRSKGYFAGEVQESKYFWGDVCRQHIDYVRTFTYNNINLLNVSRCLPYKAPHFPYFNACFFTSEAGNVEEFNTFLSPERFQRLVDQRGVCILSVHFGKGFVKNGEVNSKTKEILEKVAGANGWFVPVAKMLDFLRGQQVDIRISQRAMFILELKWFLNTIRRRREGRPYEKTELKYLAV